MLRCKENLLSAFGGSRTHNFYSLRARGHTVRRRMRIPTLTKCGGKVSTFFAEFETWKYQTSPTTYRILRNVHCQLRRFVITSRLKAESYNALSCSVSTPIDQCSSAIPRSRTEHYLCIRQVRTTSACIA